MRLSRLLILYAGVISLIPGYLYARNPLAQPLLNVPKIEEVSSDSIRVTSFLNGAPSFTDNQHRVLYFAKCFLGVPYAGGTLETFPDEHLVVRTDSVDCTTFVEYVTALALSDEIRHAGLSTVPKAFVKCADELQPYTLFKSVLKTIRYRKGVIEGYPSRLHYFSDWIDDNERKGLVKEVTEDSPFVSLTKDLNFMSSHASLYPFLANDASALRQIQQVEERFQNYTMTYIPKEKLELGNDSLHIQDGDILTLVTNIKGLDVVHVGFACWKGKHLHLLHASSAKKEVLIDPITLYNYSKTKKAHIGIRVVRIL